MSRPPSVTDIAIEQASLIQADPRGLLSALKGSPDEIWDHIDTIAMLRETEVSAFMWEMKREHGKAFNTKDFGAQVKAARERIGIKAEGPKGDWHDLLDKQGQLGYRAILRNAIIAFQNAPEWQGVFAYDEFRHTICTLKPTPWSSGPVREWTDVDTTRATSWLQEHGIYVKQDTAMSALAMCASDHLIHPVRDYLRSLQWDGTPRLDWWLRDYLGVKAEDARQASLHAIQGARWMQAAVARVMEPGCKADNCLILEGPQGKFKSTALRTIASREWFIDHIPDLHGNDAIMQLSGVWILEISEMSAIKRAGSEVIKQFLTRERDKFRAPYDRLPREHPRQCIFAASVNPGAEGIFSDETGNRRFWPVMCGNIDIPKLEHDRDQLWAEAYLRYCAHKAGATDSHPWWLDDEELIEEAAKEQAERYQADTWERIILEYCDTKRDENAGRGVPGPVEVTVHDLLTNQRCLNIPPERCTQPSQRRVAQILTANRFRKHRVGPRGARSWVYREP